MAGIHNINRHRSTAPAARKAGGMFGLGGDPEDFRYRLDE
jgi:hypothetical protein